MHGTSTPQIAEQVELPMLDPKANPDTPWRVWYEFLKGYQQKNEAYYNRLTCYRIATTTEPRDSPVAVAQWNAWLWYVANRRLHGED